METMSQKKTSGLLFFLVINNISGLGDLEQPLLADHLFNSFDIGCVMLVEVLKKREEQWLLQVILPSALSCIYSANANLSIFIFSSS